MIELREFDAQRIRMGITLMLPIQYDVHPSHVEERVRRALQKEFKYELHAADAMLESVELHYRALHVAVLDVDFSRPTFTQPVIDSRTHISPINARRILREKFAEQISDVEEFIGEAEHQDGDEYWYHHLNAASLTKDFALYTKVKYE